LAAKKINIQMNNGFQVSKRVLRNGSVLKVGSGLSTESGGIGAIPCIILPL